MILGFGWCHLQSDRQIIASANSETVDAVDAAIDAADEAMFDAFEHWLRTNGSQWVAVQFLRGLNNHKGLLTWTTSRNHRPGHVWHMLDWIAINAVGSYGVFYVHDDEDDRRVANISEGCHVDNVFRVHWLRSGNWTEAPDPYFGPVLGGLEPIHYFDRDAD